ncbi:alpha/beta fold hydrolase [Halalkalibacter sp. APA_J-10(15)]|uniref:alpha/beta fold hydrolase n=1 Tax=Halalkalibacter sp. APA_J-10(15) TaxID=2933805 RepID=UPI001FF38C45|nr:alpha/beta hydrolase [Halalkalibacter sp. APA_J-10(15)]MCK0473194.1 alpha/beta hydrolase [Halalkalibacter sp. APA_J-10(15)]
MLYKETGSNEAPLLVLIHGGGVSGWMWDKQVEHFASNYHIIVPDLPGHGRSKEESFSIESSALQMNELIKEKKSDKAVIVIGFSLGAQVLVAMLSKEPELIDFAMINSALVKPIPFANILIKSMVPAFPLVRNKTFSTIQAKSMYIDETNQEKYYQESRQMKKDVFVRVMQENMSFTIPDGFKNVTSNILVTVGEKERKVMKDSMKSLDESNPYAKGHMIPQIGHGFSLANAVAFNEMIEEWLNGAGQSKG